MADITYTNRATERRNHPGVVPGSGEANNLKVLGTVTIELATVVSNGDTIKFCRIPANARIAGLSRIDWDDLETTNAPTLDMGLASVDSNITSDPVAFSNGHALAAVGSADLIGDHANFGKKAWELVSGQTTDPGGELDVYGSVVDAATDTAGTVTLTLLGWID